MSKPLKSRGFVGSLVKRAIDITVSCLALFAALPLLILVTIGIALSSPGPILYKARRVGKRGRVFLMYKFRTMHVGSDRLGAITSPSDHRIFAFGYYLRISKIDEIPQFWNILIGDMSLVGPRPEDPEIVGSYYHGWMLDTLLVSPGVTGPGSLYGYIYGDYLLDPLDPEGSYARCLLPPKLALERAYMERAGLITDLRYILLTLLAIPSRTLGCEVYLPRVDIDAARRWAPSAPCPLSSVLKH